MFFFILLTVYWWWHNKYRNCMYWISVF